MHALAQRSSRARRPQLIGRRYGPWLVVAAVERCSQGWVYKVRCVRCSDARTGTPRDLAALEACRCRRRPSSPPEVEDEGVLVDMFTPYDEDDRCWYVTEVHEGLTFEQIGELMGVSRERVRQIERDALQRARSEAERMGLDRVVRALMGIEDPGVEG